MPNLTVKGYRTAYVDSRWLAQRCSVFQVCARVQVSASGNETGPVASCMLTNNYLKYCS